MEKIKINVLSPNPDTLLFILTVHAALMVPEFSPDKNLTLKVFVREPVVNPNCSLIQYAKQERLDIIERIQGFETPVFKVAKNEEDSDVVITIRKGHAKLQGKRRAVIIVKWDLSDAGEKIWEKGVDFLEKKKIFLDPLNGIEPVGRIPYTNFTHFGHLKLKGMILNAPGLLKRAAHLLIMKSLLAA